MQAPGGVHQHEVGTLRLGALDSVVAHAGRIAAALARANGHAGALRPHLQLLDGRRAERIGAAQKHMAARIGRLLSYLAHRGGLAGAVDAHEQHDSLTSAEHLVASRCECGRYTVVQ